MDEIKNFLNQFFNDHPQATESDAARRLAERGLTSFDKARSLVRRARGTHTKIVKIPTNVGTIQELEVFCPESLTTNKRIGDANWRDGLTLASEIIAGKRKASFNQSTSHIQFPDEPAVHFICLGDLHFFSSGTDHDAIIALTDRILAEPNLYVVLLGDILETAINMRSVAEVQSNLMPTGYQLAIYEDWLKAIKDRVLFATWDNHSSERMEKAAGCDFLGWITARLVPFFDGIANVNAKLGEQEYRIFATHKTRGRSMLNPTHGQQRYGRFDDQDRAILLAADSHVPGVSKYMDGDKLKLAVNVGTLNTKSAYARRYFSVYSSAVFPVVTLYRDRYDFSAFWTLEEWAGVYGSTHLKN